MRPNWIFIRFLTSELGNICEKVVINFCYSYYKTEMNSASFHDHVNPSKRQFLNFSEVNIEMLVFYKSKVSSP
jgi:hypothetical protein